MTCLISFFAIRFSSELFGAAISVVGLMDMLRRHEFKFGKGSEGEFGTADNKTEFENLAKYSPLHNIRVEKEYPSIFVVAHKNDERAVLCHSLKYVAELQYALNGSQFQKNPALLRTLKDAGHVGSPTLQQIEKDAEELTFLHQTLKG